MTSFMDTSVYALGAQVFGPRDRFTDGKVRSQADGIIEKLPIYIWPQGVSDEVKLRVLAFLTAFGRSEDEDHPSYWATWAFSFVLLCFPEIQGTMGLTNSREFVFIKLPMPFIHAVTEACRIGEELEGSAEDPEYKNAVERIPEVGLLPNLPRTTSTMPPNIIATAIIPAVYGYCSLLLYLAGKKITAKNVVTITERRPQNLIATYGMNEDDAFALNGDGRMSSVAHKTVNQAWVTHAAARRAVITEIAAFGAGTSLPQRVVYTVSKLLEYSGMQPAFFIHRFIQAFPQCASYACIRPSLEAYTSSVREVASAPSHLQPYYKVIHGDTTRAFHRNMILTLSACALTYEKYTSPSMKNFNLGEGAAAALSMFDAEAMRNGHPTLQSLTFAEGIVAAAE